MKKLTVLLIVVLVLAGCATGGVSRMDAGTQTDLSGYWNDTDVRIVCRALIDSCLNSPRVDREVTAKKSGAPTVIVGRFRNDSDEHIDTEIITSNMRMAIINNGKLEFVAGGGEREALLAERVHQLTYASEETASSLANEIGADFMLTGSVKTIVDSAVEKKNIRTIRTYIVTAELINIETTSIIWTEQNSDIKKEIVRPRNKL